MALALQTSGFHVTQEFQSLASLFAEVFGSVAFDWTHR